MNNVTKYIISDQRIAHGKPVFKGTRIMVYLILEMLASGEGIEEILRAYPRLTKNHIAAALKFASQASEVSGAVVKFDHDVVSR